MNFTKIVVAGAKVINNPHKYKIVSGNEIDPALLDKWMRLCFSRKKSDFLSEHGDWRHKGNENRLFILDENEEFVGYFACIPGAILINGKSYPAAWWMDLYILPQYRGKGIQRITDARARSHAEHHLGFPNHIAAKIHKKHGWGIRSDFKVRMLPLIPSKIPHLRDKTGIKGFVLKLFSVILEPIIAIYKCLNMMRPVNKSWKTDKPDAVSLSEIFKLTPYGLITSVRNSEDIKWRFLNSPHHGEYSFYLGGESGDNHSIAVITRTFEREGIFITRILDVFGNIDDTAALKRVIKHVTRDAILNKSVYLTSLSTNRYTERALKSAGFIFKSSNRLRWLSDSDDFMQSLAETECHFTFADSDNDSID